jgi:anti-anti-sigma factor
MTSGESMTMRHSGLVIEERENERRRTLVLSGELDIASVPALHAAISRIRQSHVAAIGITLDLSNLVLIDSPGLAEITLASQLCERDGHAFALIPGPRPVQRLFELTGLIDALPFELEAAQSD